MDHITHFTTINTILYMLHGILKHLQNSTFSSVVYNLKNKDGELVLKLVILHTNKICN